jgi:hypothetical protein
MTARLLLASKAYDKQHEHGKGESSSLSEIGMTIDFQLPASEFQIQTL